MVLTEVRRKQDHLNLRWSLITVRGLTLAKKSCNDINKSHAQVSRLDFFLWLCFKGQHLIITAKLHKDILAWIHIFHFGMERSKSQVRQTCYMPKMNEDIDQEMSNMSKILEIKITTSTPPATTSLTSMRKSWNRSIPPKGTNIRFNNWLLFTIPRSILVVQTRLQSSHWSNQRYILTTWNTYRTSIW